MFWQTQDEAIDFLSSAFPDVDPETLAAVYDANGQNADRTMGALVAMENPSAAISASPSAHAMPVVQGTVISTPSASRGYKMSLPDDFLRVPGWKARHSTDIASQDFMQLLADPIFLRELQREFGPDFELILREHIRAEMQRRATQQSAFVPQTPPQPAHIPPQLEQPVLDPVSMPYEEEYDSSYYGVQSQEEQTVGDKFHNIIQSFIAKLPSRKKEHSNNNGESASLLQTEEEDEGVELERRNNETE